MINETPQLGENSPEKIRQQKVARAIYSKCISSATGLTYNDREELLQMCSEMPIQILFGDLRSLAQAEEDFIGEYYKIIDKFLEELLGQLDPEQQRIEFQFIRVVKMFLLPELQNLARTGRQKAETPRKPITLEFVIGEWGKHYDRTQYRSLTTERRIPIRKERGDETQLGITTVDTTRTRLGLPAIPQPNRDNGDKNRTLFGLPTIDIPQSTPVVPKRPSPQPPAALPVKPAPQPLDRAAQKAPEQAPPDPEAYQKTHRTIYGIPTIPLPEELETASLVPTPSGHEVNIQQIDFSESEPPAQTEATRQAVQNTVPPEEETALIVDFPPPKEDPAGELYPIAISQSALKSRDLQEKVAQNFQDLREKIADPKISLNKNYMLQGEIAKCIGDAFAETVDQQYRKRVIHEIYELIKSVKDANKQKIIIQLFTASLLRRPEFAQPITPSERMQSVHDQLQTKPPKNASPSAFTQSLQELDEAEITEIAKISEMSGNDIRSLQILFTTSRNLGLNPNPVTGSPTLNIASMQIDDFQWRCHQILNILKVLDEKIGGVGNPATWFGKRRKARQFIAKLKEILPEQMAVMDQLLYQTA